MRMRGMGWSRLGVVVTGLAMFVAGASGVAGRAVQVRTTPPPPADYGDAPAPKDPLHDRLHEEQVRSLAQERHKRMVSDADKLLELATELKDEVDKSTKNEMSIAAIKKAGDIEKLAHEVKERMKGE